MKAWQVFLISVIPIGIIGGVIWGAVGAGVAGGFGSFTGAAILWGSIGLGIHHLVRNAGNKEISVYGVVSVFLVLFVWYSAFAFGNYYYYMHAIGLTTVAVVTGMYQSITRTRQKKGKGIT